MSSGECKILLIEGRFYFIWAPATKSVKFFTAFSLLLGAGRFPDKRLLDHLRLIFLQNDEDFRSIFF